MRKAAIVLLITGVLSLTACGMQDTEAASVASTFVEPVPSENGEGEQSGSEEADQTDQYGSESSQEIPDNIPPYYTDSMTNLEAQKDVESSYITDCASFGGHYWIDQDQTLWGEVYNYDANVISDITDPVKIAENVIHVDMGSNGDFVIWITSGHELFGEMVPQEGLYEVPAVLQISEDTSADGKSPVLLMEDVSFAAAGRESICALRDDGNVYWWGNLYPKVMSQDKPALMLTGARYATCGVGAAAAIDADNNLWIWGDNTWGQCGTDPSDDSIPCYSISCTEPFMAASDVEMVWVERLSSRKNVYSDEQRMEITHLSYVSDYDSTTFIRKKDGTMMACGIDLPGNNKTVQTMGEVSNDGSDFFTRDYSCQFISVPVEEADLSSLKPDDYSRYGEYSQWQEKYEENKK